MLFVNLLLVFFTFLLFQKRAFELIDVSRIIFLFSEIKAYTSGLGFMRRSRSQFERSHWRIGSLVK